MFLREDVSAAASQYIGVSRIELAKFIGAFYSKRRGKIIEPF
jgi:hypothetical protein